MGTKNCKISVRLSPWQEQVLHEMSEALGVSYSLLVRTMIGSWLTTNEDYIYNLIDRRKKQHADNTETTEENIFGTEEGD